MDMELKVEVECNDVGRKERAHNGKMIDKKREASKISSPSIIISLSLLLVCSHNNCIPK